MVTPQQSEPRDLVGKILAGNPGAFKTLVKNNQRLVGQVVFRMVSNEHDREDLCQDIFVKVYQNLARFRFDSKLSTWIARIAYTTCLNYLDKKRVPLYEDCGGEGRTIDDCQYVGTSPAEEVAARQASVKLSQEIDSLPVIYGTILSLYHLQGMTYLEISQILGLPDGTIKSYLFRARKMLKEKVMLKYRREELCA